MDKKSLYKRAYGLLNNTTPLRLDCGTLCGKACCSGDEDTGMHLFPGEEIVFEDNSDFLDIKPSELEFKAGHKVLLAVCSGTCCRDFRPLACRIFPLTPYITVNGILMIKMDPRAGTICPLALYGDKRSLNPEFIKKARSAFQLLLEDAEVKEYITYISRILDEYEKFTARKY